MTVGLWLWRGPVKHVAATEKIGADLPLVFLLDRFFEAYSSTVFASFFFFKKRK